ncbi:hypothetical protein K439DRAFT_1396195 [Ramaria rubella]|nr:hypothetical protein K439DRAFT_1396195 [Ramaria rubella]
MIPISQAVFNVSRTPYIASNIIPPTLLEQVGTCGVVQKLHTSYGIDPLRTWIIQVGIVMLTTQLLSVPLKIIRQPKVVAEVLGGIVLSPSVLGRIPGFSQAIFPDTSKPYLSLVANIGLILFLFLVGLEIDGGVVRRNVRLSASIALAGMAIPFALGSALSVALYKEFIDPDTKFVHFLLFVGVAFSITAFPVLCRILTELKLFDTTVGVVVLSAGVANDVVGWSLLALSVALASAASGLTALWTLLACVTWSIFILFPVRGALYWLAHRTGSLQNGPTLFFMTVVTIFIVFSSALFTDTIGVHAIFGSFLTGLIVPRQGGLATALTQKLEDMVSIIFLPLYFTLSGLSTDFRLLNNGVTWAYTLCIISAAWVGKFGSCSVAARISGFTWREAASVGTLMSCKGLVELIVLNVGLSAGILNTRVFSMFVLEALVLTFLTTPVVLALYPVKYRTRASYVDADSTINSSDASNKNMVTPDPSGGAHDVWKTRFTIVLDKIEHISSIMKMTQLVQPFVVRSIQTNTACRSIPQPDLNQASSLTTSDTVASSFIDALRIVELSNRTDADKEMFVAKSLSHSDPLLNSFDTFCDINNIPASISLSFGPVASLATKVTDHAHKNLSHLILIPWFPSNSLAAPNHGHASSTQEGASSTSVGPVSVPSGYGIMDQSSTLHIQFVRSIFAQSSVDVALFVDRGHPGARHCSTQHIMFPFFGGADDRLALTMVVQLCRHPKTTAKVFRVSASNSSSVTDVVDAENITRESSMIDQNGGVSDESHSNETTRAQTQSGIADSILWHSFVGTSSSLSPNIRMALERIEFVELESPTPLGEVLLKAEKEAFAAACRKARLFIIAGRSLTVKAHQEELQRKLEGRVYETEVKNAIGDVAMAFMMSNSAAELIVVQSVET